ncbi:hypothetical protein EIP86_010269 [Pleurotus ostreatoroseus]|nr:hypothetical protein EIP86_010269 [Pleurotus ostreatoroseus]
MNTAVDVLNLNLEYPPTEYSPSLPPTPLAQRDRVLPIARPELRVITEPGCYIFPLHPSSNTPTANFVGGYNSESVFSSPASASTGTAFSTLNTPLYQEPLYNAPVPQAPTFTAQPSPGAALHRPPALPKLLPNPHFRFPAASPSASSASSPTVAIPPATESEVRQFCPRKPPVLVTPTSASPVRPRAKIQPKPKPLSPASSSEDLSSDSSSSCLAGRAVSHPYARIYAKRDPTQPKQRKMWNHALEKHIFTPDELANMKAPIRRKIYIASLEAHIDALLSRLYTAEKFPIPLDALESYYGLNCKTVKSMVSGLYKDAEEDRVKLLELERAVRHISI